MTTPIPISSTITICPIECEWPALETQDAKYRLVPTLLAHRVVWSIVVSEYLVDGANLSFF